MREKFAFHSKSSGRTATIGSCRKKTAYFKQIEKEISKNRLEVQFLESITMQELAGLYRLADIFVYPVFICMLWHPA